ncbi:hypothetical protein NEOLEDRAFT_1143930 [Neolentinus lepideus HHB14362 ss-1]|uniref:Uncharacterized protein n=1 Tax=Neolentinus lepideus HHB14362 ss-1 TaxID=1314782 RepID=A0A165M7Q1_9AGAM|nr:hypothetical protein NEOLEDRAFT_1143930 [Neolentinus lepideus HHB14362 ss-1]
MLEKFKSGEVDIPSSSMPDCAAQTDLARGGLRRPGLYAEVRASCGEQEVGFGFWVLVFWCCDLL